MQDTTAAIQTRSPHTPAVRTLRAVAFLAIAAVSMSVTHAAPATEPVAIKPTIRGFREDMPRTIRADHPAILPVAAAIRAVTQNPLEQLVMVNDVTHLLVDYDDDERVYHKYEYYATLDQMLEMRREHGWLYLRDDCDGRAVFAAHLLASLGIPWRLEASSIKGHAWVSAVVNGTRYDLLDFKPGDHSTESLAVKLFTRPTNRPPSFSWRVRWAEVTHRDVNIGLQLGLLTLDSNATVQHERRARDWTVVAPYAKDTPVSDDREFAGAPSGFPYGEVIVHTASNIPAGTIASNSPASAAPALATPTQVLRHN